MSHTTTAVQSASPHVNKKTKKGVTVKAYQGDHMTLLAFDLDSDLNTEDFVGFSIQYQTPSGKTFFIPNMINFKGDDKLVGSDEAPIQKFRWLHVPGSVHQTLNQTEYGDYIYFVTPRYYDKAGDSIKALDTSLTVDVTIPVGEFKHELLEFAFTRSYVNSQAYKYRFGSDADIIPTGDWLFDTNQHFTTNNGQSYTYEQLYEYLGFTARQKILDVLHEALNDTNITLEMFTYDFNEPVIAKICLQLAKEGRIKIISDDYIAKSKDKKTGKEKEEGHGLPDAPETSFFEMFNKAKTGNADIIRHHFTRYQHNKQIIFSKQWKNPYKVLTGSTNFSITGICVNANHVAIFDNSEIAAEYSKIFNAVWTDAGMKGFKTSDSASKPFSGKVGQTKYSITFSPHQPAYAAKVLDDLATEIKNAKHSVLFSVMQISGAGGNVMPALKEIKNDTNIFSYGVTDAIEKNEIELYRPGRRNGILVNAQAITTILPPPFNREDTFQAHKIHHKFVVVDFNTANGKVYFGSSNLALGGEENNGDNLICITDPAITTVFAIEALRLVDHFHFRALKFTSDDAIILRKDNVWAKPYYDDVDIKSIDRKLFVS
ncbi:MAG TPA: phospholipase D-like domain-containing protein [Chitinophagaceae bacterium]